MNETTTATFQSVAGELANAFTSDKRDNGDTFYKLKDDAPDWINVHDLHHSVDDRFPDDWIYEKIAHLADSISEYEDADSARDAAGELADQSVDIYYSDLSAWFASNLRNAALCEDATDEFGMPEGGDMFKQMQMGQYIACDRLAHAIIQAIEDELENRNN